jgi:hypothetical protein
MMRNSGALAFVRALRSEFAKLRRARVLRSALIVPAGFVMLKGGAFALRGEEGLGIDRYSFEYLFSIGQFFWERLLIPLFAVTICTWLVWLEDESGHWKVLLTQPIPRGAVYFSKLIVAFAVVVLLQSFWWLFHTVGGLGLGLNGREAIGAAGPHALRIASALTPVIGVQLLLSVLLRSPFAALGIGLVGNTASLVLAGTAINYWHPWGLAQVAGQSAAAPWTIWTTLGTAAALSWAGVVCFARKDI